MIIIDTIYAVFEALLRTAQNMLKILHTSNTIEIAHKIILILTGGSQLVGSC